MGAFCLASGLLSLGAYGLSAGRFDLGSLSGSDWFMLLLAGLGPMGLAFFAWDAALKRGDPRIIGSLAYMTPLFSTLILVLIASQSLSPVSGAAMALIVGGAVAGSLEWPRHATASEDNRSGEV